MPHAIVFLCALLLSTVSCNAKERDLFSGEWVGFCSNNVDCSIIFKPNSAGYFATINVLDTRQYHRLLCSATLELKQYSRDVLISNSRGTAIKVIYLPNTEILIDGLSPFQCGEFDTNGRYRWFSDE